MPDLNELNLQFNQLKSDISQISVLVDRLDITIGKLTEVATNVSQLLAVQGNRLDQQEKASNQLSYLLEKRRDELIESTEALHKRINTVERDIETQINKLNDKILDEMKAIRDENKHMHSALNKKITELEKWMWVVTGGAAVVGFLLSKMIDFDKIF